MSDRDYAPLSLACVRALIDKQYDKRKAAASEIEKYSFSSYIEPIVVLCIYRLLYINLPMVFYINFALVIISFEIDYLVLIIFLF